MDPDPSLRNQSKPQYPNPFSLPLHHPPSHSTLCLLLVATLNNHRAGLTRVKNFHIVASTICTFFIHAAPNLPIIQRWMTHTHHNSPKKNRLIGSIQSGLSISAAGCAQGIPRKTASDLWHKFQEMGTTHTRPRFGRPRKVTSRTKHQIVKTSKHERRLPLPDFGNQVDPQVSASTVRKVLDECRIHRRKARKAVYLTRAHKKQRLAWARRFRRWMAGDWRKVIWSNECYVYIGDS